MHRSLSKQSLETPANSTVKDLLLSAANEASSLMREKKIPNLNDSSNVFSSPGIFGPIQHRTDTNDSINCLYTITAFFSGFVISFIDSVPSEIAVVSARNLDLMAQWDNDRTSNATAAVSIGWLQIDNQCPSASFPVALAPLLLQEEFEEECRDDKPFLSVGIVFAPRHKSNILVRSRSALIYYIFSYWYLISYVVFWERYTLIVFEGYHN